MAELTNELIDQIFEACRSNIADLTQSLGTNLSGEFQLAAGEEINGPDNILGRVSEQPGIVVTLKYDGFGILCLIPEDLPIPGWYRSPNDSQASQLQTLPMEWSVGMVPMELEAVEEKTVTCENLRAHLEASQLVETARMLELSVITADGGEASATIHLVMPVVNPITEQPAEDSAGVTRPENSTGAPTGAASPELPNADARNSDENPRVSALARRIQRVNKVPVDLIVRIAERKLDLQQLRSIAPGTLLMFDKPYDSLLDVFINNRLYCRGEAVKIGETFGIKISECNSQVIREKKVHQV
ncbi:MAG: FliM/FliN family flagellar motor switch protein [Rhodopirellula sp.]|nr:FliM/FliN family flagellar motor switch protein [Rhodopirellula sp.]